MDPSSVIWPPHVQWMVTERLTGFRDRYQSTHLLPNRSCAATSNVPHGEVLKAAKGYNATTQSEFQEILSIDTVSLRVERVPEGFQKGCRTGFYLCRQHPPSTSSKLAKTKQGNKSFTEDDPIGPGAFEGPISCPKANH